MRETEPLTVYTVNDPIHAEIVKNALEAEGIPCMLSGVEQASIAAVPGTIIQVQVPADDAERACAFLVEHEASQRELQADEADESEVDEIVQANM